MIVPDGVLFSTDVASIIKKELIENFNLHTIVRLPKGVFAPYTSIETNLLFFKKGEPTKEIWYYEHPLPEERRKLKNPCYTKTKPLRYEEFKPLRKWWNNRERNEYAWKVPVENVIENNYDLDIKNPSKVKVDEYEPPEEIVDEIMKKEKRIIETIREIDEQIRKGWEKD